HIVLYRIARDDHGRASRIDIRVELVGIRLLVARATSRRQRSDDNQQSDENPVAMKQQARHPFTSQAFAVCPPPERWRVQGRQYTSPSEGGTECHTNNIDG